MTGGCAFGVNRYHPLRDGNKRTSRVVALRFFALNGRTTLPTTQDQADIERLRQLLPGSG